MHRLRVMRQERKLSQVELARRAGLTAATIHRIEHSLHSPTPPTMRALAEAFGMSVGDLEVEINPQARVLQQEVEQLGQLAKAIEMAKVALADGQVENTMSVLKLLEETVEGMASDMRECVRIARGEKKESPADKLDELLREYEAATALTA